MSEKEQKLETLQSKVSEVKKCSQSQETPAKLQVINVFILLALNAFLYLCFILHSLIHPQQILQNDLCKKISTVHKLHDQVKANLTDFTFQRKQLEDYITQMSAWLKSMEDSLVSSPTGSDPEDICKVKVQSVNNAFIYITCIGNIFKIISIFLCFKDKTFLIQHL